MSIDKPSNRIDTEFVKKIVHNEKLAFLAVLTILTLLLSTGLSTMTFKKGIPLPSLDLGQGVVSFSGGYMGAPIKISALAKKIVIIIGVASALVLVYIAIRKIKWKEIASGVLRIFLTVSALATGILVVLFFLPRSSIRLEASNITIPEKPVWFPLEEAPTALLPFIIFILALLTSLIIGKILISRKTSNNSPNLIELEALNALNKIKGGNNLKNAILTCYHNMCSILQDEHEIKRDDSMTVEEFEKRIGATGAPQKSIHTLTVLFEAARYGNKEPNQRDKTEAMQCLEDIIFYFSSIRKK